IPIPELAPSGGCAIIPAVGLDPGERRFRLARWLFFRLLALSYLAAFLSIAAQVEGLVGSHGILPIQATLDAATEQLGADRFFELPTLAWIDASDVALKGQAWLGAALAVLLLIGLAPTACLILLWAL